MMNFFLSVTAKPDKSFVSLRMVIISWRSSISSLHSPALYWLPSRKVNHHIHEVNNGKCQTYQQLKRELLLWVISVDICEDEESPAVGGGQEEKKRCGEALAG